ncbi:hypothetical protein M1349_05300 [Patescibacteria group bacterium]|nr:hypothetical protein [Patescibacteria group bacterium]
MPIRFEREIKGLNVEPQGIYDFISDPVNGSAISVKNARLVKGEAKQVGAIYTCETQLRGFTVRDVRIEVTKANPPHEVGAIISAREARLGGSIIARGEWQIRDGGEESSLGLTLDIRAQGVILNGILGLAKGYFEDELDSRLLSLGRKINSRSKTRSKTE